MIQDIIQDPVVVGAGATASKFFDMQIKNKKNVYCFIDNKTNKSQLLGKKILKEKEFFELAKDKLIMSLVIILEKYNNKNKLLLWKK